MTLPEWLTAGASVLSATGLGAFVRGRANVAVIQAEAGKIVASALRSCEEGRAADRAACQEQLDVERARREATDARVNTLREDLDRLRRSLTP